MLDSVISVSEKPYKIVSLIGEGGAATVYLAKDQQNKFFAMKMIKNYNNPIVQEMTKTEIRILKEFKGNRYIIQFEGFKQSKNEAFLILELGECSLRSWIDSKNSIWQDKFIDLVCSICQGLMVIHNKKMIHRDIKPENIIKIDQCFKITDFGVSCESQEDEAITGTQSYWAPEVIFQNTQKFTNKLDVWSLGVTMFEVYFKVNPFCPRKQLTYRQAQAQLRGNIQKLTPNFTIQKFLKFLQKQEDLRKQYTFIKKKLQNTNRGLIENLCQLFDPNPQTRPDINLCYALFDSLRQDIQLPTTSKTKIHQKYSQDLIPEDIKLFCNAKDLFYELSSKWKSKFDNEVLMGLQLGIWYLQGVNYEGVHYVKLDKIQIIKNYKKAPKQLKNEVKENLSNYYFHLKLEQEQVSQFRLINSLKFHILLCSVWWPIIQNDKKFCEAMTKISAFQIDHPLKLLVHLENFSQKIIGEIENYVVNKYYYDYQ